MGSSYPLILFFFSFFFFFFFFFLFLLLLLSPSHDQSLYPSFLSLGFNCRQPPRPLLATCAAAGDSEPPKDSFCQPRRHQRVAAPRMGEEVVVASSSLLAGSRAFPRALTAPTASQVYLVLDSSLYCQWFIGCLTKVAHPFWLRIQMKITLSPVIFEAQNQYKTTHLFASLDLVYNLPMFGVVAKSYIFQDKLGKIPIKVFLILYAGPSRN